MLYILFSMLDLANDWINELMSGIIIKMNWINTYFLSSKMEKVMRFAIEKRKNSEKFSKR